ncbi:jg16105 [Pararge aegeria aegeria]|uniref:Jg16105 protein n=1 Tax=Pararge aegeria aegeria TaxID=348720 RepID=A0A8S4S5W5_9NEOP|nr:jg16105 [Pararge aegeria aegeria]
MAANYGPHKKAQSRSAGDGGAMLGVSLRDQIRNEEIHTRTRITDIDQRVAKLKWQWAGHIPREPMDVGVLRCWSNRTGKRSGGRSPTRWTDDIRARPWTTVILVCAAISIAVFWSKRRGSVLLQANEA